MAGGDNSAAAGSPTALVVLHGPIDACQASGIYTSAELLIACGAGVIVCEVQGTTDLSVLDALARLRLLTRRTGVGLRLQPPGQDVDTLLAFAGLEDVLDRDC